MIALFLLLGVDVGHYFFLKEVKLLLDFGGGVFLELLDGFPDGDLLHFDGLSDASLA